MMGRLLMRKIAVLLALAFGQMCGTALAQTSPPPAAKAASRLTLRVALADAGSSLREVVVQTGEKEFQSIAVNPYRISKAVVLKAMPAQLNVFAKNAETTGAPLASVPMPATVRRALVVLSPGPTKESPAPQAIVLDEAQFPAQSIWFQNSTANPVALQMGAEWQTIVAGATHLFRPDSSSGKARSVQMVFYEKMPGGLFRPPAGFFLWARGIWCSSASIPAPSAWTTIRSPIISRISAARAAISAGHDIPSASSRRIS